MSHGPARIKPESLEEPPPATEVGMALTLDSGKAGEYPRGSVSEQSDVIYVRRINFKIYCRIHYYVQGYLCSIN